MRKIESLEGISDGNLYDVNSMVKAESDGCKNCSHCCYHIEGLVELNPYDLYELSKATGKDYKELLNDKIEVIPQAKLGLFYLKMDNDTKGCSFLDSQGRCSIHPYRPGICRLFPLGRVYSQDDFKYYMQVGACIKPSLRKVKVKNWINIESYKDNKDFILTWRQLLKALSFKLRFLSQEESEKLNDYLHEQLFNIDPKSYGDFYQEFYERLPLVKDHLGLI